MEVGIQKSFREEVAFKPNFRRVGRVSVGREIRTGCSKPEHMGVEVALNFIVKAMRSGGRVRCKQGKTYSDLPLRLIALAAEGKVDYKGKARARRAGKVLWSIQ